MRCRRFTPLPSGLGVARFGCCCRTATDPCDNRDDQCLGMCRSIQPINNLKQDIGAGFHRLVISAFDVNSGVAIFNPEMGCLGRRRWWWWAMATGTHRAIWAARRRSCTLFRTAWHAWWRWWRGSGIGVGSHGARNRWCWWLWRCWRLLGKRGSGQCSKGDGGKNISFHRFFLWW